MTGESVNMMLDVEAVEAWLLMLHGDSPGLIHVCSTGDWSGRTFDLQSDDLPRALAYIEGLNSEGRQGIYLRATTIKTTLPPGQRGSAADSMSFPGFWADIDLAGPGHAEQNLPRSEAEGRRLVAESGLPDPTVWVHSGGGLYPWWLLSNPHVVTKDLGALQTMSEAWQRVLGHTAERLGFKYGTGVHDLARVLRIPGTINRKADLERPCRLLLDEGGRTYTLDELRGALQSVVAAIPAPPPRQAPRPAAGQFAEPGELTPLDDFEARTDWAEILEPAGWLFSHQIGRTRYWVRPGKSLRDGHSASTGLDAGRDRMFVFSTAVAGLDAWQCYTKGYVYAALNHGGNMSAAARELSRLGYGTKRTTPPALAAVDRPGSMMRAVDFDTSPEVDGPSIRPERQYPQTDLGNAMRLVDRVGEQFRYVPRMNDWMAWNGRTWEQDHHSLRLQRESGKMFLELVDSANIEGNETLAKHGLRSQADSRIKATVSQARVQDGVAVDDDRFDADTNLITFHNGVLDLKTMTLRPHDPRLLLTRSMNANFDMDATCPRFLQFMEEVQPESDMVDYLSRLGGYTMEGKPSQRVAVLLSGPAGTGKSKYIEIMQYVFGDMGSTAAASTFRRRRNDNAGLDPGLHALRGARFVATSETSQDTRLDEELIKRVTGRDHVTSRTLNEKPQTWMPRFVLWMASNYEPKIDDDDGAMWGRIKSIRFEQQFTIDGSNGNKADADLLEKLYEERDGIAAWLIRGYLAYKERGLDEPAKVTRDTEEYRRGNDTVLMFVEAGLADGSLIAKEGPGVGATVLYQKYMAWCASEQWIQRSQTRFGRRIASMGHEKSRGTGGGYVYHGLHHNAHGWLAGSG